jgi:hypothetical protein
MAKSRGRLDPDLLKEVFIEELKKWVVLCIFIYILNFRFLMVWLNLMIFLKN